MFGLYFYCLFLVNKCTIIIIIIKPLPFLSYHLIFKSFGVIFIITFFIKLNEVAQRDQYCPASKYLVHLSLLFKLSITIDILRLLNNCPLLTSKTKTTCLMLSHAHSLTPILISTSFVILRTWISHSFVYDVAKVQGAILYEFVLVSAAHFGPRVQIYLGCK